MDLSHFDGVLFALSLGGQLLLCIVLLRSRLYRAFPIFSSYILYASITDVGYFLLQPRVSDRTYFLAYFANNVPEFLLQIGILVEIARNVLNPVRRSLPRISFYIFGAMLAVGTLVALLLSMHSQPVQLERWARYFVHLNFGVAILRLAIFAAIAAFSQFLGINWRNHVLQIATGFLGYSIVVLLVKLLHRISLGSLSLWHVHEQLRIIGWCMALSYWSYSLSRAEAPRKEFSPQMAEFLVSIGEASRGRAASARWYRK